MAAAILGLWTVMLACLPDASATQLIDGLSARVTSLANVSAHLTQTAHAGREREKGLAYWRAQLLAARAAGDREREALMEHLLAQVNAHYSKSRQFSEEFRALLRYPDLRFELIEQADRGESSIGLVAIYTEGRWRSTVHERQRAGASHYVETSRKGVPLIGAVLGLGIPSDFLKTLLGLSGPTVDAGLLSWPDLFALCEAADTRREGDLLWIETATRIKTGGGGPVALIKVAVRVNRPTVPSRAEVYYAYEEGKHYLARLIAWTDYKEFDGVLLGVRAEVPNLRMVARPEPGVHHKSWPITVFEESYWEHVATDVAVNATLRPDAFELPPMKPGDGVLDFVRGEQYVVGNAGEILDKQALKGRELLEDPGGRSWLIWLAWGGAALSVVIVLWWMIRRLGGR